MREENEVWHLPKWMILGEKLQDYLDYLQDYLVCAAET